MCGIAGLWYSRGDTSLSVLEQHGFEMRNAIKHRGPDGEGFWCDEVNNIALVHQRLAVQDLSPNGHQPMNSFTGRWTIVFNGEIYNHLELRDEIERDYLSVNWRGTSDTETFLAALEVWELANVIDKLSGMFAAAIWDNERKTLSLVRDRFGEKPLYYCFQNGNFFFGSELKAITSNPRFLAAVDNDAVCEYFYRSYIPSNSSIFRDVFKLKPGSILTVDKISLVNNELKKIHTYWDALDRCKNIQSQKFQGTYVDATNRVDELLRKSVEEQTISDQPLGAFLSGGVDSSIVASILTSISDSSLSTFTIGFEDQKYDESKEAREIARHIGTDHTEIILSFDDIVDFLPNLCSIYDEPFADSSQIPTYFVSKLARGQVTVALSGDGGDELFGGYNRHIWIPRLAEISDVLPKPIKTAMLDLIDRTSQRSLDSFLNFAVKLFPKEKKNIRWAELIRKGVTTLRQDSSVSMHESLILQSFQSSDIFTADFKSLQKYSLTEELSDITSQLSQLQIYDTLDYLPSDILTKVDRAAMAVSLETRAPFLNRNLAEFAWSLPDDFKVNRGVNKRILRDALRKYLPDKLSSETKKGFGIPLSDWLLEPFCVEWVDYLFQEKLLKDVGILDEAKVKKLWSEHQFGDKDNSQRLWTIIMFQSWVDKNIGRVSFG